MNCNSGSVLYVQTVFMSHFFVVFNRQHYAIIQLFGKAFIDHADSTKHIKGPIRANISTKI